MAQLSQKGFNFLKGEEGYKNVAYTLPGESYPTVGFGHHAKDLINGKYYSDTECMAFFKADAASISADVNKIWTSEMTQSMFDAMFSMAYNHGNISRTTLGNVIKGEGYKNKSKVTTTWHSSYTLPGSQYHKTLSNRRVKEANLFYSEGVNGGYTGGDGTYGSGSGGDYYDSLAGVQDQYSSNAPSVLSNSASNIYNELTAPADEAGHTRTRIYKYSDPTIKVDELSIPLDGQNTPVNQDTGMHYPSSSEGSEKYANVDTAQAMSQKSAGTQPDITLEVGVTYPIIRINDYYFSAEEIDYMEIASTAFVPTLRLDIVTTNNDLLKTNTVKEGDVVAIFCSPGHGMIKSLRCDFLITYLDSDPISQHSANEPYKFTILGELFIPNLHNANMSFSFAGTSRDALIDAADKLGLGFFFSDPENTEDNQLWYCMAESESSDGVKKGSNLINYIQDTAAHSWKNFESFFDCWIDPRYGLSFININKMLGEHGRDEVFDITLFTDVFTNSRGVDNQHGTYTDQEKKTNARPQIKMITNIANDDEAGTPFYAIDFQEVNNAAEVTKNIGISVTTDYVIDNQGVAADNNSIEMTYSIPYNPDKYPNGGFYILIGPGTNGTYVQADNGSYVKQNAKKMGGRTSDIMADSDGEVIAETGSNEMSTGNVNKFYDAGYEHNKINNMQLLKKLVKIKLNGANFAMMRGEKIPVMLIDNNKLTGMLGLSSYDTDETGQKRPISMNERRARMLNACVYTTLSGWFIIKSIKWTFSREAKDHESHWGTELELTRREWPIPGYNNVKSDDEENQDIANIINTAQPEPEKPKEEEAPEDQINIKPEDVVDNSDIPLTGLKQYMKDIFNAIKEATSDVKLVGARRYAVDTNGNKVNGNAFIHSANGYKCMDAKGNIMYLEKNNSRHLYGEAIDIINGSSLSFQNLWQHVILVNGAVLKLMHDNGVSAYVETSIDDMGTKSKHIHIGTDTIKQSEFWQLVDVANNNNEITYNGTSFNPSDYTAYNSAEAEYQMYDTIAE